MPSWDIDPQEVGGVLSSTASHIGEEEGPDGLLGQMRSLEFDTTLTEAHINSTPVTIALECTSEATTHYMDGQYEMAEEAQNNAGTVPLPPPPPYTVDPTHRPV
ncbi:DUF6507 family protein [Nocardiopsis sp. LOL_012]|uniref:DUF6507 family protein n=1 Tax=Nocardiopsis sp. LOL_012 TaxID=3345409 RepID=UPI003A85AE4E